MRVSRSTDDGGALGPSAVSVGKFDGVHVGHRAIISRLRAIAAERDLSAVVVTFDRNPLALLMPDRCPDALISTEQKLDLLAATGVAATVVLPFDAELAALSAEAFIRDVLVGGMGARVILTGPDFRFGAGGRGDVALLRELAGYYGYSVEVSEDIAADGKRVSSSEVRQLLAEGDVASAARLLGRNHSVRGEVVRGAARGRELGFPTANLAPGSEGLIPADGVYAGLLIDEGVVYPAAISVGNNPTFIGVPQKQVEAHVLDRDLDLYGHRVDIEFVEWIRPMLAFSGIAELVAQIDADVKRVRELLL